MPACLQSRRSGAFQRTPEFLSTQLREQGLCVVAPSAHCPKWVPATLRLREALPASPLPSLPLPSSCKAPASLPCAHLAF